MARTKGLPPKLNRECELMGILDLLETVKVARELYKEVNKDTREKYLDIIKTASAEITDRTWKPDRQEPETGDVPEDPGSSSDTAAPG